MLNLIEQVSDLAAIKIPSNLIRSERLVSTGHLIQIETRAGPPLLTAQWSKSILIYSYLVHYLSYSTTQFVTFFRNILILSMILFYKIIL